MIYVFFFHAGLYPVANVLPQRVPLHVQQRRRSFQVSRRTTIEVMESGYLYVSVSRHAGMHFGIRIRFRHLQVKNVVVNVMIYDRCIVFCSTQGTVKLRRTVAYLPPINGDPRGSEFLPREPKKNHPFIKK